VYIDKEKVYMSSRGAWHASFFILFLNVPSSSPSRHKRNGRSAGDRAAARQQDEVRGARLEMEQEEEPNLRGDSHPEVWDLICVGTGLTEALLAGCVASEGLGFRV